MKVFKKHENFGKNISVMTFSMKICGNILLTNMMDIYQYESKLYLKAQLYLKEMF